MHQTAAFLNGKSLVADWGLVLILAGIFCSLYLAVLDIQVWRHDAAIMLHDYNAKLISEGRWLNYIFFPLFKRLPPQLSIFLCLACWGYFSFVVARRYTDDRRLCLLFVLLSLQLPAFYSVVGWPSTILSAFVIIALMAYLSDKVSRNAVFFLSGFLLFGSFNNFYNLILLLYIKDIAKADLCSFVKIFLAWVFFFVTGYLGMLVLTKILGGHWGLLIADWRHPHYIHGLGDVIFNLKRVWADLKGNLALVSPVAMVLGLAGLCFMFCVFDALTGKKGNRLRSLFFFSALCAVAVASHVQAVPLGLGVASRTAVGLYTAIAFLALFLCARCRTIGLVFVFVIAMSEYCMNVDSIRYYVAVTNTLRSSILSMDIDPAKTEVVHICSEDAEIRASEQRIIHNLALRNYSQEWFGANLRQPSIFHSAGFRHFDRRTGMCRKYADLPRERNGIHSWVYKDNHLYVWTE